MKFVLSILLFLFSIGCFAQSISIDTVFQLDKFIYLAKVKAWDPDGDPIKYSIEDQEYQNLFMIEKLSGWLYVNTTDLEFIIDHQKHEMFVCVSDDEYTSCSTILLTINQPTTISANETRSGRIYNRLE